MSALASGVRKPSASAAAVKTDDSEIARTSSEKSVEMARNASTIVAALTIKRSASRVAPTQPDGKLVNVLCSGVLQAQGGNMRAEPNGRPNARSPAGRVCGDNAFEVCERDAPGATGE